jgi:hypothetical protein
MTKNNKEMKKWETPLLKIVRLKSTKGGSIDYIDEDATYNNLS